MNDVGDVCVIMIINTEGFIIRIACSDISVLGRITSGVKLINLTEGVTVAGVAKVRDKEEKDNKESAADNEETQETPEENRGETE